MKEKVIVKQDEINIPKETYIECDGWYLVCPTCWHSDIEPFVEKCEKCNQLFKWDWLIKEKERKKKMDRIDLDVAITNIVRMGKPIEKALIIKKYIPIQKKLDAIDELYSEVFVMENEKLIDIDPIKKYVKFTLMAIKLYTNLDIEGTYEEYDKLQSNGLIDKIFKEIKGDYMDLKSFMDMRFEYNLARYYSSIQQDGDMIGY